METRAAAAVQWNLEGMIGSALRSRIRRPSLPARRRVESPEGSSPGTAQGDPLDEPAIRPLIDAARKGDGEAFGALFSHFEPDVARLCTRLLRSPDEAKDAAHETFLRARQGFHQYDAERPFRPWLLGIAAHHSLDRLRRHQTERELFAAEVDPDAGIDPGPSPLQGELDAELRRRMLAAIDTLPDRYRAPLVLRYYSEFDYETIGELLEISRGQVGSLLYRARVLLRTQLSESI